eukprot:TRINITY_DN36672_c0_g1_i3.p1 TRINITY_DN36672_c0_g1~~TRINITY_DN36672_c0_g1_i3.p1  ORF type:complete len:638 (-),score=94.11 TRINITY_DN36672_c0_g1_i3:169-2082(-)
MHFQSSSVVSWVLQEVKENDSDSVTVICKGGERVTTSGLLLAAIAPYLAHAFNSNDSQDTVILLPDVESEALIRFLHWILASKNHHPLSTFTDKEAYSHLDGIFWQHQKSNFVFPLKSESKADQAWKTLTFTTVKDDVKDSELTEDVNLTDDVKCEVNDIDDCDSAVNDVDDFIDYDGKIESTDEDFKVPSKKRKKKEKKAKSNKGVRKKIKIHDKDPLAIGEDSETELLEESGRKPLGRPSGKTSYVKITEDELPKDANFTMAQEKLRADLLDENKHTNPQKLWFQYHGHSTEVKFSELNPVLVCPICLLSFSLYKKGMIFFLHLQRHKYQHFQCACMPKGRLNVRRKHILTTHWNWPECQICQDVVDPDKMANHLRHKHGKVNESTVCQQCGTTFTAGKNREYKMHMEYHRAETFVCDCQITFKNKQHKVHHIQTEHIKEMLGCDKCHFLCSQESTLREHVQKKHNRSEETEQIEDTGKRLICDICGYETKSSKPGYLERHKARMHDPVLLQCPHCPAKFNASALKQHVFNTHESNGICNICGAQVKNIKRHMKNMHQPKELLKYKCQFCDRAFQWAQDIKKHVMNVHLKERPYKCRFGCEVAYNDSSNRNQHEKRKHGGIFVPGIYKQERIPQS